MKAATPELEHPPFSNDQHDEDAHVLSADADANLLEEASAARGATVGLLGDGWESRRTHRLRSSMGKGGSVFELSGVFDSVGSTTEGVRFFFVFFFVCVCVCVFSSHPFWTSMDVPAGVTQEEGHTGFLIHLPSAVRALIFVARRIQPFLSLVDREVEFCVLTN